MTSRQPGEEAIFHVARGIENSSLRSTYFDQVCADNEALRHRVEALLEVHEREDEDFLESTPGDAPTAEHAVITEAPGQQIGRYKLLDKLGEGGMGTIFMAEQLRPVRRRVAVKIIKQGMDTQQFIARFEAERQALALMDHPNIARVLDAGCTETGRPYFVMELVKGVAITRFCDENRLTALERVKLFVDVCHAVQHAHQKGIIHRDLKPSNVLIALYDDKPVPKVIDFGVAKAVNQQLTERTLFTQVGQIVGTWQYMSPEQAVLNQLDVDTRTDLYALGVILYELLTGVTPLEPDRLRSAAIDETLRLIREEEPQKPSTRITSLGEAAAATAAYRSTDISSLTKAVRGDMDWIVMKALEKNRARRYDTANALAADLDRYLVGEAIEARPPSTAYRLKKAVRRHKAAIGTGTVIAISLLLTTGLSLWQARKERRLADQYQQALEALRSEIVAAALNAAFRGSAVEADEAIARAKNAGAPRDLLDTLKGLASMNEGDSMEAFRLLESACQENPDSVKAKGALYWACWQGANYERVDHIREQLRAEPWSDDDYDNLFLVIVRQAAGTRKQLEAIDRRLNRIIERHPLWGIAYSLRSANRGEIGWHSKDIADFDLAFEDLQVAARLIPKNPFIETEGMYTLANGIELSRHIGLECPEWRQLADDFATDLENQRGYPLAPARVAWYYYLVGKTDRASELETQVTRRGMAGGMCPSVAQEFSTGKTENLVHKLRAKADSSLDARLCLAMVLAGGTDEERRDALEITESLSAELVLLGQLNFIADLFMLLDCPERARQVADNIPPTQRVTQWQGYAHCLDYYADRISEVDLIEFAEPLSSTRCFAYYAIGMRALAEGDRGKAKECFQKTRDSRMVSWWYYHWGKAFAARMEADENWGDWIVPSD